MTGLEVLSGELNLPEEWQLGAGGRLVWAPSKPTSLDLPGFRDAGCYNQQKIDPVFAISLLDEHGRVIHTRACERNWTPARLESKYRLPQALITERRTVMGSETLLSEWTMSHAATMAKKFWLVLWTHRSNRCDGRLLSELEANPQGISFQEAVCDEQGIEMQRWGCAFGASFDADSWSVNSVSDSPAACDWEETPFFESMSPDGLPGHVVDTDETQGTVFCALAYPFEIPPGEKLVVSFAASFGPDVEQARRNLEYNVSLIHPVQHSEEDWISWFEEVPDFQCSDPMLTRLYWYRWAQQRVWGMQQTSLQTGRPTSWNATCQRSSGINATADVASVIDGSWTQNAEYAWHELRSLLANQNSGQTIPLALTLKKVQSVHPDEELLRLVRHQLSDKCPRDLEPSCQEETIPFFREGCFLLDLVQTLSRFGTSVEREHWKAQAKCLANFIQEQFWKPETGFFGECTQRTSDGFLSLLPQLVSEQQKASLLEQLYDPERFWTRFPLPSLSRDETGFQAEGFVHGHRSNHPRNGRIWLNDVSLIIDGLGKQIEQGSHADRILLAELIRKSAQLAFPEQGDLNRPATYAHYNPFNGKPAKHLGRQAKGGGWFIDHILRFVAGVRPRENGTLVIDPLPFGLEWFSVRHLVLADHELDIEWDQRSGLTVRIDEEPFGHATVGQSLSIALPEPWAVG